MSTIINHAQPGDEGNAPLPGLKRYALFTAVLETEAARRALPYEPWPLPPWRGCPQAVAEVREARGRQCPLCEAPSGVPCQRAPVSGDHLARYLDALTAGQLTREFMAAVLGELVVIGHGCVIPDGTA